MHAQREGRAVRSAGSIRGEVTTSSGTLPDRLMIEVVDLTGHGPPNRLSLDTSGRFEIEGVRSGSYEIRVTNLYGDVIHRDYLTLEGGNPGVITLRLPDRKGLPAGGVISAKRLQHPVPSKAAKEFRQAEKATQARNFQGAIEHLKKAIEIYPDYAEAHNNLGGNYMQLDRYEEAAAEFQRAVELENNSASYVANLGSALIALGRYPEAEAAARRAVELDPHSSRAQYGLGLALVGQQKQTDEAVESLQKAGPEFPKAHLLAAQVLARMGAIAKAIWQARAYLGSARVEKREEVEAWVGQLEKTEAALVGKDSAANGRE